MGFVPIGSLVSLLKVIFPPIPLVLLFASGLIAFIAQRTFTLKQITDPSLFTLGAFLWLIPALLLFFASTTLQLAFFHERYLVISQLGLIILINGLITTFPRTVARSTMRR